MHISVCDTQKIVIGPENIPGETDGSGWVEYLTVVFDLKFLHGLAVLK